MKLLGLATPVWGSMLDAPEGWVAPWTLFLDIPKPADIAGLEDAADLMAELSALGQELQPDE